jgi:hypothetical protein
MDPSRLTEELKEYLRRLFLGRIRIRSLPRREDASSVTVRNGQRSVTIHRGASKPRIVPVSLIGTHSLACSSKSFRTRSLRPSVRGGQIVSFPTDVHGDAVGGLSSKIRNGARFARVLPQERRNRSSYVSQRPLPGKRIFLAYYAPVIREAVLKTALNRQKGTLLIWYNLESRAQAPYGTFLMKKIGEGGGFEWEWSRMDAPDVVGSRG